MKSSQVAFGRRGSGKSSGKQAVFGMGMGGNVRGRKSAGQTARPKGEGANSYGSAHSRESSYTDGYASKLGGGK